jgi:hypothetical protein
MDHKKKGGNRQSKIRQSLFSPQISHEGEFVDQNRSHILVS